MNIPCDTCVYQPYCSEQRGQCSEYVNKHKLREEVLNAGKFILAHPELDPERQIQSESGGGTE